MSITQDSPRAMILAAGKGTRLRPLTDSIPKALVPVNGTPLVKKQIDKLGHYGFNDIVVNVHHFADMLCDYIAQHTPEGMRIRISSEKDRLLNTGGALRRAAVYLLSDGYRGNVLVHNVDIISNVDLRKLYESSVDADATLLVSKRNSPRRLLFNKGTLRLMGWTNLNTGEVRSPYENFSPDACESFSFAGIHVISPRLLEEMQVWPEAFSIIDFYLDMCVRFNIRAEVSPTLRLLDVGKADTLAEADNFEQELQAGEG